MQKKEKKNKGTNNNQKKATQISFFKNGEMCALNTLPLATVLNVTENSVIITHSLPMCYAN